MPSDDYASLSGRGALKLKGAKVKKHKKKKDKGSSNLEKALSTGESSSRVADGKRRAVSNSEDDDGKESGVGRNASDNDEGARSGDDNRPAAHKTEAERRFAEVRRKKLLEMSESAASRPELLKTHKERVEELNTYLSKLSEHHDMPKIGPG